MNVRLIGLAVGVTVAIIVFSVISYHVFGKKTDLLNNTYPLTAPILNSNGLKYRIAIISDLNKTSKSPNDNTWISYFNQGYLIYNSESNNITIEWDSENSSKIFKSHLSMDGRGSEFSELVTYNGRLITVNDKIDMVYQIDGDKLIPWVILAEGDGYQQGGQKNEWATVKDSKLYVGLTGYEYGHKYIPPTLNMWVKVIDQNGAIEHLDWTNNYIKVRAAFNTYFPGYMVHESCVWSNVHRLWFFLPRKAFFDAFIRIADERKATNLLLTATSDFSEIKTIRVGEIVENHGYASFKFIPGTNDKIIIAIKTMEKDNVTATYITAFTIKGEIIYPETRVFDKKFEGFEFA